jgi:hypothetical protein
MRRLGFLAMAILTTLPLGAFADSLDSLFQKANNAFWNGDYEAALKDYKRLDGLGVSDPTLSYNLGTAYAMLGKLGMAVQQYERALRLDPGQDDARHNLSVLREFIARRASEAGRDADLAPAAGPWRAVLDRFSSRGAALTFLVFHIALFLVLAIRRFVFAEMPRLSLGVLAGVLVVLTLFTGVVAVGKWYQDHYVKEAVVVADNQTSVMEGPLSAVMRFALEEGSRVTVVEENAAWVRVQDSEGRDGWVPAESLGRI